MGDVGRWLAGDDLPRFGGGLAGGEGRKLVLLAVFGFEAVAELLA